MATSNSIFKSTKYTKLTAALKKAGFKAQGVQRFSAPATSFMAAINRKNELWAEVKKAGLKAEIEIAEITWTASGSVGFILVAAEA
jgi:hypothetical protein